MTHVRQPLASYARPVALIGALAAALSGCAGAPASDAPAGAASSGPASAPPSASAEPSALGEVELEVSGEGEAELALTLNGEETLAETAGLPWTHTIAVTEDLLPLEWELTVSGSTGDVVAEAFFDGEPLTSSAGSPGSDITLSGSVGD
ncbi:hypothetical protein [Allonocardiopsis opalescens]|uniref:Uncharacterized protein n=1 Tax=Allonocardiopsis opalescens TaxID=1144618 RepID=A0A2T0QEW1_9ACTN|nr:hypothetical protein [Allonocardiopsis opalescens]PRY02476.1 hypothetical protein CLV72_1011078 [Allonocardiopsis opalescens]